MQEHYENTANATVPQTSTLDDFIQSSGITIPQLTPAQQQDLEEEFSEEEVRMALQDAVEKSASGPSGQSLAFFKLLFFHLPQFFTSALNELVFAPGVLSAPELLWIRNRKVIYIPKKSSPQTPADYRPLSMLEVLYKIPSRILSKRISTVLSSLIGPHQHGFMRQKGIQEPSIIITHLIQDANSTMAPLQLVSFDIEKAFDRVSHSVILQSLRSFHFPEIYTSAIQNYTLSGTAAVEVNGQIGNTINILRGSGQGDPLSSSLFLLASEPINLAIIKTSHEIQYRDRYGNRYPPVLFADDNLCPLSLTSADQLLPILRLYKQYYEVSGLNVNPNISSALCINTLPATQDGLQEIGLLTPTVLRHLGIFLSTTLEETIQETIIHTDSKLLRRRILATTPPTDLLHRALLINTSFIPIYNHVLMALPLSQQQLESLDKEVRTFFWTRNSGGETIQKRKLVAMHRIPAPDNVGGLNVPLLETTAKGFRLNLLQKIFKKTKNPHHFPPTLLPSILSQLLQISGRPSLEEHITGLGTSQWEKTAKALKNKNLLFSQLFTAGSEILKLFEQNEQQWHQSPIFGHSQESIFLFTTFDYYELQAQDITTVSQLLAVNDNNLLTNEIDLNVLHNLPPNLQIKLHHLMTNIIRNRLPLQDKRRDNNSSLHRLLLMDTNSSIKYRQLISRQRGDSISRAPAYSTRVRDQIYVPEENTFSEGYLVLKLSNIPSKTKETAFQILNRTIWTNNKSFKSGLRDSPSCDYCDEIETMEHLIHDCQNYSYLIWHHFGKMITTFLADLADREISRVIFTPKEIIFNKPHPSILRYISDHPTRKAILLLIQEIKRNIIYRRMNIRENQHNIPTSQPRVIAHLLSTIKKLHSLYSYAGLLTFKSVLLNLQKLLSIGQNLLIHDN